MKSCGSKKSPSARETGEMKIRICGVGQSVRYPGAMYSSRRIRWVSRERTDSGLPAEIRDPMEKTRVFPLSHGFFAAGRRYTALSQLFVRTDETAAWCWDAYGRQVLYLAKRYPCFDCFDAAYEDRFYRWFFLREGNTLTRVYFNDGGGSVYVTEDVANLETYCCEEMERAGFFA